MPGFFDKIQAKIELFRLEQRYTRNRHRRSTYVSNAVYVDGEYVYQTPSSTGSSANSSPASSPLEERRRQSFTEPKSPTQAVAPKTAAERKRMNRFSSMPGFGVSKASSARDWRQNTVDVREVR
ncbi:hypothetical protein F4778DRAFT_728391 [Xylariomycetidae sp. FL2044]|nr:hypothetical protein F4778DRAFT_728391 [Xylariomycetidae sp. FL2044]